MTAYERMQAVMKKANEPSFRKALAKTNPSELEDLIEEMLAGMEEPLQADCVF